METGSSTLVFSFVELFQGFVALAALILVIWIWRKGPRWIRIVISLIVLAAALALGVYHFYLYALGNANWSY